MNFNLFIVNLLQIYLFNFNINKLFKQVFRADL